MKARSAFVLVTSLVFAVFAVLSGQALAANPGANKVHVSGSAVVEVGPGVEVVLLSTTVKTSDKADLLVEFNGECFLTVSDVDSLNTGPEFTEFGTTFNTADSESDSVNLSVLVWVEVDGIPLPVDPSAADLDDGKVNFCDLHQTEDTFLQASAESSSSCFSDFGSCSVSTTTFVDVDLESFVTETTSSANSFRWFAFDLGNKPNPHTVEVLATLSQFSFSSSGGNAAQAVVGRRTMVATPLNNLQ